MRKILTLSLFLLLCLWGKAQQFSVPDRRFYTPERWSLREKNLYQNLLPDEAFFNRSEVVVEARLIRSLGSYDPVGGFDPKSLYESQKLYSLYAVRVDRVYKGKGIRPGDTLYIARNFGRFYGPYEYVDKDGVINIITEEHMPIPSADFGVQLTDRYPQILFLVSSDLPDNPAPTPYSGKPKYKMLQEKEKGVLNIEKDSIHGLNHLVFPGRVELYRYLQSFPGYTVPDPDSLLREEERSLLPAPVWTKADSVRMDSLIRLRWGDSGKPLRDSRLNLLPARDGSFNTLTLWMDYPYITENPSTQTRYLEFDVLASTNNPALYFDAARFRIGYDTTLFGSCVVTQNKLTLTLSPRFGGGGRYWLMGPNDLHRNAFDVACWVDGTHQDRILLDTLPEVMLHVRMELLPGRTSGQTQLSFRDTLYLSTLSSYALSSDAYLMHYIDYDKTYFRNPPPFSLVKDSLPVITTNLSSLSLKAGVGDTLTLRGRHFGNQRGTVQFTASSRGGFWEGHRDFLRNLDAAYYLQWTDSLIQVIVPSIVYKGYEQETVPSTEGAGSGPVRVITVAGDSCESATALHIPWAIMNRRLGGTGGAIRPIYLARKDCGPDFQFTLHREFQHDTQKIAVIDSALRRWSLLTGLTLCLERDAQGNLLFADSIVNDKNLILPMEEDRPEDNAMTTSSRIGALRRGNDTLVYRGLGSHIRIRESLLFGNTWSYALSGALSSNEVGFYQCFLHELGHILLLGHVNNAGDLLYPSTPDVIPVLQAADTAVIAARDHIAHSRVAVSAFDTQGQYLLPVSRWRPVVIATPAAICNGDPVLLTSSYPAGNQWSTGATTSSLLTTATGSYTVSVQDGPCTLVSEPVTLVSSSLIPMLTSPTPICPQTTGNLSVAVYGDHPPFTYRWSGNGIAEQSSPLLTGVAPGTYSLWITNQAGCQIHASVALPEVPPLQAEIVSSGGRLSQIVHSALIHRKITCFL